METAAVTMEWAMVELLHRPDAMAAATSELDRVVGRGRWVTESDLPDLPYLDAVVKETMRLHPVGPLLIPHQAREDAVVGGYDVPAGARVLVNAWAVGRDPASWPEAPGAFRPGRFFAGGSAEGVGVHGTHFQLLPFGSGRRMCPAHNLVMKEVWRRWRTLCTGSRGGCRTGCTRGHEHGGILRAERKSEGAARCHSRAKAAGALLRRSRLAK
ncbi:flavonoid 3' [Panicum miliaceum]|uniref:Flavonoid 3 n=1 Tax=Panicum miliaceum TaxID=4540 RepID=A0A3L6SX40_PANMI|nr:flavonoid 3' [Panicum miliaceum]